MNWIAVKVVSGLLVSTAMLGGVGSAQAQAPAQAVEAPAASTISAERLGRLRTQLQRYVDEGRLAGAVVMIQQDGKRVFSEAVGWRDKEARDPMREDTIFRIASQTKALTSVAVMMLMEEGKLLLDDPVGKHLPAWKETTVAVATPEGGYETVPANRPITIRDLLTHTAGISYGSGPAEDAWRDAGLFGWYFANRSEPVSSAVAHMASLPMAAQPGEKFVYGYNTDILGVIVEKLSGKSLQEFLDERLIKPLGMKDTSFYLPREKADRLAVVYEGEGGGLRRAADANAWKAGGHFGQGHYLDGPRVAYSGGAGLLSTAADYSRFLEMMRRGGELDGRRYLSGKSVELMVSNHLGEIGFDPGMGFGLGFSIRTDLGAAGEPGSEGEFGWGGAYHSQYWVDPEERLTVTYMTQLLPAGDIDDHGKLRALIYQAID
ncbi:serine hydrolase domain-containing protein [Pelagerythrobacter aerophilus]|uniref:Class A beta-lactamase-related serine hydrolase n=1 Tax=Pelagerythrobacter aerophilus TaxID=2306995 RepID=A0A418NK61_9SPHN|nr:serine hydrolase domain-containing protein [Pelagerythrobacter aerophilus]RIV79685.1 class A beta-lactamase-related serine hydrolase [Pelagerythrobacter aerophilus]